MYFKQVKFRGFNQGYILRYTIPTYDYVGNSHNINIIIFVNVIKEAFQFSFLLQASS